MDRIQLVANSNTYIKINICQGLLNNIIEQTSYVLSNVENRRSNIFVVNSEL